MTFEDTPPEKKRNLIDLKTPPAPREESYESVRLQAEFIKMQQNAAALERKKQSRSSGKPKKVNNSDDAEDQKEQELFALREKLETQERRLRQLEAVTAKSASSLTVPKQHRSQQQQQQQQQRATTTTKINRENEEKKIEARVRLLQALRIKWNSLLLVKTLCCSIGVESNLIKISKTLMFPTFRIIMFER